MVPLDLTRHLFLLLSSMLMFLRVTEVGRLAVTAVRRLGWRRLRRSSEEDEVADGGARLPLLPWLRRGCTPQGVKQVPPGGFLDLSWKWTTGLLVNHVGQELRQLSDVNLRHLESVILGQLSLVFQGRNDAPQFVKRFIQTVHSPPLPSVGCDAPVPLGAKVAHFASFCRLVWVFLDDAFSRRAPGIEPRYGDARFCRSVRAERVKRIWRNPSLGVDEGEIALLIEILLVLCPAWKLRFSSHRCSGLACDRAPRVKVTQECRWWLMRTSLDAFGPRRHFIPSLSSVTLMSLPVPPAGLTAPGCTSPSDPVKGQLDKNTPPPIVYCNSITDTVIISHRWETLVLII